MDDTNQAILSSPNLQKEPKNVFKFDNVNLTYGDRVILDSVCGEISSQNILALMGPSGSGKSSLLNVLSYRKELLGSARPNGHITINNIPVSKKDRYKIGYVMQEDLFFPTLTLYETLTFYVNLRISNKYTKAEKDIIISKLCRYMHLEKCMNTIMGGGLMRGLSGGERKRASVACELITDPIILMLDEPTSGLDSYMAANVINILKDYCKTKNKIVIASIHQPSSQIFHSFDSLVLLSCGKLLYEGPTDKITHFFGECGFKCPEGWNIADYILDVVSSNNQSIETVKNKFNNILKEKHDKYLETAPQDLDISSVSNKKKFKSEKSIIKWPAGKKIQFLYLLRRSFILSIDDQLSLLNLSKSFIICLLLGIVWFQLEWNASNLQNIMGLLYYATIESFSSPFFGSVFIFTSEKPVIGRERLSSMYSLFLYYNTKIISEIPSMVVRPLIYTIIVYPMTGLQKGPTFLIFFVILFFSNFIGESFGLFLSSLGLRQKETLTLMVILFIVFNLYGGFFTTNIPYWLAWGKYISPIYQLYVLQLYSQFSYKGVKCNSPTDIPQCINTNANGTLDISSVLEIIRADIEYYWCIVILFCMTLLLYIVTFLILRKTITKGTAGFKLCDKCTPAKLISKTYKPLPNV